MKIRTLAASAANVASSYDDLQTAMARDGESPSFVAIHHRAGTEMSELRAMLGEAGVAVHGATSCQGIMINAGLGDVGLFVLSDPDGDYGTACAEFGEDPYGAARDAAEAALSNAGRDGEAPDLIWVSFTPGCEEQAIKGIEEVVGPEVPIIGGSAADDTVAGQWSVSDAATSTGAGIVVSVLFCSTPLHFAYQNGYEPTEASGTVTKAQGRSVFEINNRPAVDVYQEWNGGNVPTAQDDEGANILSEATFWPLGRKIGSLGGVSNYLLAHPCMSNPDGSLELFAEVLEGEELVQMKGEKGALAERAGRVAEFAQKAGNLHKDNIAGALMVYCGGCMLAVQDRIEEVYRGVDQALEQAPFLGVFTFGEQGAMHGTGNRHGNLMISCITFAKGS